jgi:hypothetical protein
MMRSSFFVLAVSGGIALASVASCSPPSKGELERQVATRATPGTFRAAGVSTVFEKRCGSLDCHGAVGRNLRIYSSRGLRLPNEGGVLPGQGDTTLDEITANYQSIMTLEPELTNDVVLNNADPETLLVLKKPLDIEKHKGGPTIRRGDDADRCIRSWMKEDATLNPVDRDACTRAAVFPRE